jgi:hypothetical protein
MIVIKLIDQCFRVFSCDNNFHHLHLEADPELTFSLYGILSMTRGVGDILGGAISSALVASIPTESHQCSAFPKGPFSGLIWFTGIVFLMCGLIGSLLWLHFRPVEKLINNEVINKEKEDSLSHL